MASLIFLNASRSLDNSISLYDSPAVAKASLVFLPAGAGALYKGARERYSWWEPKHVDIAGLWHLQYGHPTVVMTAISAEGAALMVIDALFRCMRAIEPGIGIWN